MLREGGNTDGKGIRVIRQHKMSDREKKGKVQQGRRVDQGNGGGEQMGTKYNDPCV